MDEITSPLKFAVSLVRRSAVDEKLPRKVLQTSLFRFASTVLVSLELVVPVLRQPPGFQEPYTSVGHASSRCRVLGFTVESDRRFACTSFNRFLFPLLDLNVQPWNFAPALVNHSSLHNLPTSSAIAVSPLLSFPALWVVRVSNRSAPILKHRRQFNLTLAQQREGIDGRDSLGCLVLDGITRDVWLAYPYV